MHCNNYNRNQGNNMVKENLYDNKNKPMTFPEQKPSGYPQQNTYAQQPVYQTPVGYVQPTPYSQAMNYNPNTAINPQTGLYYPQPMMEVPMQYTGPTALPMQEVIIPEIASPTFAAPISEQPLETPVFDIEFTQGYLRTQIGRKVKVEFLIGTNMLIDRDGTLMDVGISYIIIQETETDDLLLCDIYSIKFVRFYY